MVISLMATPIIANLIKTSGEWAAYLLTDNVAFMGEASYGLLYLNLKLGQSIKF